MAPCHPHSGAGSWYNYDNPNDRNNFCAGLALICLSVQLIFASAQSVSDDEVHAEDNFDDGPHFPDLTMNATQLHGFGETYGTDLVQPIRQVEKVCAHHYLCGDILHVGVKISIAYEKMAKRVDVKQLQSTIWTDLTSVRLTACCLVPNHPVPFRLARLKAWESA